MAGAWWIAEKDIDPDQQAVIRLPASGNHLVVGPPGSGKTNILLLRAKYLMRAVDRNIAIVVFTRALTRFIASGGRDYGIPKDKITTCMKWQRSVLEEYGAYKAVHGTFQEKRDQMTAQLAELVEQRKLSNLFSAILLDEAQDYTPQEIALFRTLGKQLFAVADGRQQIYRKDSDPLAGIRAVVDQVHPLRFHYRNGQKICRVADAVASDSGSYSPLLPTCRYDEATNPSQVSSHQGNIASQCRAMAAALRTQLRVFKGEFLGVVCPTKDLVASVWEGLRWTPLSRPKSGGPSLLFRQAILAPTPYTSAGVR